LRLGDGILDGVEVDLSRADAPAVHLIVGLPCSGKTTFAKRLAGQTGALRLTPDDWHARLFGNDTTDPGHDQRHDRIEQIMWDLAQTLVARRIDVILDFGFWTAAEREQVARRTVAMGAKPSWHYMDVSAKTLRARANKRNADPSYTMKIPMTMMDQWIASFQPPNATEALLGPLQVITTGKGWQRS